jgi:3-oxoadipate enol-lactonase
MPIIRANGINTYYEITGSGEPLIFVHGLGSSTRDWEHQVEFFSKKYQVITYDLRGHGKTDKPAGPYTIKLFAADAAALIKALGIGLAHIGGISLGGMIVFQLLVDQPQLFKSAIITNCLTNTVATSFPMRYELTKRRIIFKIMPFAKMGEVIGKTILPGPEHEETRKIFLSRFIENDPKAYYEAFLSVFNWSVTEYLSSVKCPVLVISSEFDNTPVAAKKPFVKLMPNAKLAVIKDAHHGVNIECPDKFNETVMNFLSSLS